jgi:hypothetical protein
MANQTTEFDDLPDLVDSPSNLTFYLSDDRARVPLGSAIEGRRVLGWRPWEFDGLDGLPDHEMPSTLTFNLGEDDRGRVPLGSAIDSRRVLGWRRLPSPETKTDYEQDCEPTQWGFAIIAENLQCGCTGIGVCEIRDVNYGEGGSKEMTGVPYICTAPVSDRRCLSERWHKPTDEIEQKQYIPHAKVLVYFKKLTRSAGCIPRSAQIRLRRRASELNFNLCEQHPSLRSFWDSVDAIDHSFADPDNSQAIFWASPPVHRYPIAHVIGQGCMDPLIARFLPFNLSSLTSSSYGSQYNLIEQLYWHRLGLWPSNPGAEPNEANQDHDYSS